MEKGRGRERRRRVGAPRLPDLGGEGAPPVQDRGEEAPRRAQLPDLVGEGAPPAQDRGEEAPRRARLPDLVGEGAPPTEDRGEETARRARLAAVIEALWAGLQGLGRLLRFVFFARRQRVEVELPAVEEEEVFEFKLPAAGGGLAMLYGDKLPPRRKREPRRPPSPSPSPLLMVKGKPVPGDVEAQYKEYCRKSACVPEGSVLCHLCFFEKSGHGKDTFPDQKMISHCKKKHGTKGDQCQVPSCRVRLRMEEQRDCELHMHFCHPDVAF